jgi:hypothetical protein
MGPINDGTPDKEANFNKNIGNSSQKFMMEREIRSSLAKLERLSQLLPDNDTQKAKATSDLENLKAQFGEVMMKPDSEDQ